MNRINDLFHRKKQNILNIYFTAGYPNNDSTLSIIEALSISGADMIEIGIPYSDPIADGETIQASNQKALRNGMTLKLLFEQLTDLRKKTQIPVLLMGYLNPIYQFGVEKFCRDCAEIGIDGVIIPDLPIVEYETEYQPYFEKYSLKNISLITPQTSDARIKKIDAISDSFIYVVSTSSITGTTTDFSNTTEAYFQKINNLQLSNPTLIGFGINNNQSFTKASMYANGGIIGSEFIRVLDKSKDLPSSIASFIKSIIANP